ncbi:hypothetical protein [Natrinema salaciae]|uniref:Uncharacterized protein n=1 Tax=Natrinema salaciae TaxID=1186196 RepID=A0A1H9RPG3_9EURY|nr:hypothetical protein [Natrinema salaciae]SER74567.1 hypothetical protein SAMN04489841_4485 [Natrinema salaciae]
MGRRIRPDSARRRQLHRRLRDLEADLEECSRHLVQLENTLRHIVRTTDDVTIGGPCRCGQSLLILSNQSLYCPQCSYRRTV